MYKIKKYEWRTEKTEFEIRTSYFTTCADKGER